MYVDAALARAHKTAHLSAVGYTAFSLICIAWRARFVRTPQPVKEDTCRVSLWVDCIRYKNIAPPAYVHHTPISPWFCPARSRRGLLSTVVQRKSCSKKLAKKSRNVARFCEGRTRRTQSASPSPSFPLSFLRIHVYSVSLEPRGRGQCGSCLGL